MKWGTLIRKTYGDIIISVSDFTKYAQRILLSKTTEDMWEKCKFKRDVKDITTSFAQKSLNRSYYLESCFKTNCKKNELFPIQQDAKQ